MHTTLFYVGLSIVLVEESVAGAEGENVSVCANITGPTKLEVPVTATLTVTAQEANGQN